MSDELNILEGYDRDMLQLMVSTISIAVTGRDTIDALGALSNEQLIDRLLSDLWYDASTDQWRLKSNNAVMIFE